MELRRGLLEETIDICRSPEKEADRGSRRLALSETTPMMTAVLPQEILNLIVDHLRDDRVALKDCCLVSKTWVSRARRHLFARVEFTSPHRIEAWREFFPDPSTSPARHTRILVNRNLDVTAPKLDVTTWIHSFNRITQLELNRLTLDQTSLIQLYGLSPTLTSLLLYNVHAPVSGIFNLICSFPLLENLALHSCHEIRFLGLISCFHDLTFSYWTYHSIFF